MQTILFVAIVLLRNKCNATYVHDYTLSVTVSCRAVSVTAGKVEIVVKKTVPHENWETLGTYLPGHGQLKHKRGVCVCVCL